MVVLDHRREELVGEPVVGESVDFESKSNILLGRVEHVLAACDAGVVDEDGWVSYFGTDLLGDFLDRVGRGDVALVIANIRCYCLSAYIQQMSSFERREMTYAAQRS
jgi:hypothetical protein